MARKKSATPIPEELEPSVQSPDIPDSSSDGEAEQKTPLLPDEPSIADEPISEETMSSMESASKGDDVVVNDVEADNEETDALMDDNSIPSEGSVEASGDETSHDPAAALYPADDDLDNYSADEIEGSEPVEAGPTDSPYEQEIPVDDGDEAGDDNEESYESILHEFRASGESGVEIPESAERGNRYGDDALLLPPEEDDGTAAEPSNGTETETSDSGVRDNDNGRPSRTVRARRSPASAATSRRDRVLTIDARDEIQTEEERESIIWHDIQNSHRTRRILTGTLDGVEKLESGSTLAVVSYKGIRVAIPVKEMLLHRGKMPSGREYIELMDRLHRILNARLGSEIDFIVKGYDNDARSVVGSRREAMLRKRKTFYMDTDELGEHLIYEGRVVQARVVAVAEKVIQVEVFGVETSIVARGLSWEWIGDAREHFSVGDRILVRVLKINRPDLEHLNIRVDARSVSATNSHDNLKKCTPQCRYVGRVTDVRNGVVFIRLNNGANAIAHSCYDPRYPGKKDDVSFAVTRIDEEQGVAIGIITRIIKQNL